MNPLTKMRVRNFFLGVGGQLGLSLSPFGQDQVQQEIYESSENPHDGFTFVGKGNQKPKIEPCRVAVEAQNQSVREGNSITTAEKSAKEGNNEVNIHTPPQDSAAQTVIRQTSYDSVRTVITPSISFCDFKSYTDASVSILMKSLLTSSPPSAADIKASVDVLSNLPEEDAAEIFSPFPGLFESLPLAELRSDPEQFSAVLSKATESLQVKNKWTHYFDERVAIHGEEENYVPDEQEITYIPQELFDNHGTWDALTEKYKCSICQDVKAAPVVLSCEHNFCFACIEAHKKSCTQDTTFQYPPSRNACYPLEETEEEDIVVHKCPNCKTEITHDGLYERDLDETICQLVGRIGDTDPVTGEDLSERKEAYHQRREIYQNAMRIKRQQQQKRQQKGETGEQSAEDSESSIPGYDWYLPIVMFAIVAIIAILRR